MAYSGPAIPRLGLLETLTAVNYVRTGEWLPDYRAALGRLGIARPPKHLLDEIRVMKARFEAGDEDWRDGSKKPRR